MIPKIIHYCWMSDDAIPEALRDYMNTWQSILPNYEFVRWNYDRFPRGKSRWVDEAFDCKMYAFCADYIRLYALYNYGGIYLDMDVEMVKDFGELLQLGTMVCKQNKLDGLELAAFGVEKGSQWVKVLLDEYNHKTFIDEHGNLEDEPLPYVADKILKRNGYTFVQVKNLNEARTVKDTKAIPVLPCDYLSPKLFLENRIERTVNTCCIHHFASSWTDRPAYELWEQRFWNHFGLPNKFYLTRILNVFTMRSNLWGKYKKRRKK